MQRNNRWLAILAVSAVLPILRNGLAGEQVDYGNNEPRANHSKAAYGTHESNLVGSTIETSDKKGSVSRDEASNLDEDRASNFLGTKARVDPARRSSAPKAISRSSSKIVDADPIDANEGSFPANGHRFSLPRKETRLRENDLWEEGSSGRSNELGTAVETAKRSAAEILGESKASSGEEISRELRLSRWISRDAIKEFSGRANDLIHLAGSGHGDRKTGTPAARTNQWISAPKLGGIVHPYYDHVERSWRDDDASTTSRTTDRVADGGRKTAGFDENRATLDPQTSDSSSGRDAFGGIDAKHDDIGFSRSSMADAPTRIVEKRSSSADVAVNGLTEQGSTDFEPAANWLNGNGPGTEISMAREKRRVSKRDDRPVYNLMNGIRRVRRFVNNFKGKEKEPTGTFQSSLSAEPKNLTKPDQFSSHLKSSKTDSDQNGELETSEREEGNTDSSKLEDSTTHKSEATRLTGIPSKEKSTINNDDDQTDNRVPSSLPRESRIAYSAWSTTISVLKVDSSDHPASVQEKGNSAPSRGTLNIDTTIRPRRPEDNKASDSFAVKNDEDRRQNRSQIDVKANSTAEDLIQTPAEHGDRNFPGNQSGYSTNHGSGEPLMESDAKRTKDEKGNKEGVPDGGSAPTDVTKEPEKVFADSQDSSVAAERNFTYPRRDMNSLAAKARASFGSRSNDRVLSRFGGRNAQAPVRNSEVRSPSTEKPQGFAKNSRASGPPSVQSSSGGELGSRERETREEIVAGSEVEAKRPEVDDRSVSLEKTSNSASVARVPTNYTRLDEKLNGSGLIVSKGISVPTGQDLLNQNRSRQRPDSTEIEDNESPWKSKRTKAARDGNGTTNQVNPDEKKTKSTYEGSGYRRSSNPPAEATTETFQESLYSPKEKRSKASRTEATAKGSSGDDGTASSPKIDPTLQTWEDDPSSVYRSTGFIEDMDQPSTVSSETKETTDVPEVTFTTDIPFSSTDTPDHGIYMDSSIVGPDDDRSGGSTAVASSGNVEYSHGNVEDASSRSVDNSSHELEPLDTGWPVKHSAVVEGDLVLGGLMMVHEREDTVTCGPVMPQGGVQALEAMLYTLDRLNDRGIVPGVKIGAHILDDCDKDTYGLEMAVDFIKGSISNIDGAEYHCNKTAVRKVISGVVGAASSVTSIQVANLLRLFRIPQVSFFSTSPELSNKQRFEYFTRTIPSDHYQVKAMVDIVLTMGWSYVSIIYEESNYGIKAFEELEELLGKYDICIAIKEKLVKDSGVAEETAYDNIVLKLLTKPRARGCIIFGSDQEVAGVMRAVRRCNATGAFSWIGSDGWSARGLVSNGNEPEVEGTLSVQPQANPVRGFEGYFLNLTVENNRRNPWFVEFWEDHFQCRYPNASKTPYNQKYTKPCTTKERLTKQSTAFEDQLQFVSDAVMAFAYAFRDMHRDLCHGKPGLCDTMKPTKGTELLKYLRKVDFEGLSGDKFKFDKNGDGPARYNIIHFKQTEPGKYKWVRVGKYLEGELRLNMSEIQFKLGHPQPPESVCSLPCEVGQAKKYVEGERCCWHCFNCTQYQIRHPKDETQCIPCRQGTVPDETHSTCRDIPEEFLRPESGWAIGAMSFSATGMLVTFFVCGVFLKHNDTPVVRASGRELSYILLSGILLCYLVTFALVLRPTDIVCGIQRFAAGFCFTVVYAALLTKTNRISRIFNASKHSAKRPSFISPRSQLIICSGLVFVQILINGVWMIIDPARAMHHYPTREDNLLVCNSYIDASYMIAFAYPIMLIVVCTVYAVLTRKIPEAFNESKHIGFTMYTTCVIWLAFVPLYFGTGSNVALRITSMSVTISLSASVTIACLFSPKLYIILIRPERNVRQSMMPARYSTTKSSAVTATNASSMIAPVTLTAATCDQNKTVKKHIIPTIDCSTQSEYYELEVKDQNNGKPPPTVVSRSTQTSNNNEKDTNNALVANKDAKENTTATTKQLNNNARIGNGPVNQSDVSL